MAPKNRASIGETYQSLGSIAKKLSSLSDELLAEVRNLEPYLAPGQEEATSAVISADIEQIKKRFFHQRYEWKGFIVETRLLDNGVYISWDNTAPHLFKGLVIEPVCGYRNDESMSARWQQFIESMDQKRDYIDYDIRPGVTRYYRFEAYKVTIKMIENWWANEPEEFQKDHNPADFDPERPVKEKLEITFSAHLPDVTDELEVVQKRLAIKQLQRQAMTPAEREIEQKEQQVMKAGALLRVAARAEEERGTRLAEIKKLGLPPEEEAKAIELVNGLYDDLGDRINLDDIYK